MGHFGTLGAREVLGLKHCRGRQGQAGRGRQGQTKSPRRDAGGRDRGRGG